MKLLLDPITLNAGGGSGMSVPPINAPSTLLSPTPPPVPPVVAAPAKPAPGALSRVVHTIEGDFQHVEAIVKSVFTPTPPAAPTMLTAATPIAPAPVSQKGKALIGFVILAVGVLGLSYIIHLL